MAQDSPGHRCNRTYIDRGQVHVVRDERLRLRHLGVVPAMLTPIGSYFTIHESCQQRPSHARVLKPCPAQAPLERDVWRIGIEPSRVELSGRGRKGTCRVWARPLRLQECLHGQDATARRGASACGPGDMSLAADERRQRLAPVRKHAPTYSACKRACTIRYCRADREQWLTATQGLLSFQDLVCAAFEAIARKHGASAGPEHQHALKRVREGAPDVWTGPRPLHGQGHCACRHSRSGLRRCVCTSRHSRLSPDSSLPVAQVGSDGEKWTGVLPNSWSPDGILHPGWAPARQRCECGRRVSRCGRRDSPLGRLTASRRAPGGAE
eukprot:scaffold1187_cov374-Prasinococcus_capsulatus_cf.AAC.8